MRTDEDKRVSQPGHVLGKVVFALYLLVAVAVLLELLVRTYFAAHIGPRVFLYGTPWYRNEMAEARQEQLEAQYDRELAVWNKNEDELDMVSEHEDAKGGYLKFFPNEPRYFRDIDSGETVRVSINAMGFRGPDYTIEKPDDVIRILTLGASSTFGFYSRDKETYPYLLEQKLNGTCDGGKHYEVINFAIPHARAEEIRSMLVAEGLALDPDVITFYEGRNDSYRIHPMDFRKARSNAVADAQGSALGSESSLWAWTKNAFITARLADEIRPAENDVSSELALDSLKTVSDRTSRAFIADLEDIRLLAAQNGIVFIVANQQANSKSWFGIPAADRLSMKGVTYDDEVAGITKRLNSGEAISGYEFNFLVHNRLMQDLEAWVREKDLPFVDLIQVLDGERHHLVSWVHLDAYANGLIADHLAREILTRTCARPRQKP